MKLMFISVTVLWILWQSSIVLADMYTWADKEGNIHFSDTPIEGAKKKIMPKQGKISIREEIAKLDESMKKASSKKERDAVQLRYIELNAIRQRCRIQSCDRYTDYEYKYERGYPKVR